MMNAIDVIRIGRSRSRHASSTASQVLAPACSRVRANSTIRIAFLHASPTSTIKPICVKTLLSPPVSHTPAIAREQAHRHDQDHRRAAARSSRTAPRARGTRAARTAGRSRRPCCRRSAAGYASSVHSNDMPFGSSCAASFSIAACAWPEREARRGAAVDLGGRVAVVVHHLIGPERLRRACTNEPSGTISPRVVAHLAAAAMSSGSSRNGMSRLRVDLVGAAEAVEVVDVQRAEVDLHRLEQVGERHALRLRLVAIDVGARPAAR